jgi:hypothetical protein
MDNSFLQKNKFNIKKKYKLNFSFSIEKKLKLNQLFLKLLIIKRKLLKL